VTKMPTIVNFSESSKKCAHCGLTNFPDHVRCARCGNDVWVPVTEPTSDEQLSNNSREFGRVKISVIIAAVLLSSLVFLYFRKGPQGTPGAASETFAAQPSIQEGEQPAQDTAKENPESREAARHVLAGLKRFQAAANSSMSYEEYEEMLGRLKADMENTLPSFTDHNTGDESFRAEVNAAIRDYTAAGNWWKTVIRNSSVFTDADRTEKLVANWTSAKAHLETAEQMLAR